MVLTRHERISDLFLKACELDPDRRAAFLEEVCAGDPALRAEVESLLDHDEELVLKTGAGNPRSIAREDDKTKTITVPTELPRIEGYRILRLIGTGGMGRVYLAEDTTLGRRVAIKITSEQFAADTSTAQRFVREARTMATVEHPHIVRVYSFGETEGRHYLVMEYVEGESLAAKIRRLESLEVDDALRMLRQVVDALEAAWEHGIIHRDVKPANILLDARNQVHVADFGLAKTIAVEGEPGITRVGEAVGTPYYFSPEQAFAHEDLDFRADIYSLGVVLFEMLTGAPPFRGGSPLSIVNQHINTPVPTMRSHGADVPGEVEQLCEWMVHKRPADRPESYAELRQTIDALFGRASDEPLPSPSLPSFLFLHKQEEVAAPVFVGRKPELDRLGRSLEKALGGEGDVVFVTGEAGSGKTALITEFARRAQETHEDLIVSVGNCDAHTGPGDPYLPFREVLSLLTADVEFRRASREITWEQAHRLWALLPLAVEALVDSGPDLLGTFLSGEALVARAEAFTPSPAGWRVRLEELVRWSAGVPRDVSLQQSYLFEQYARTLHALAQTRPLLLLLEDLHWADGGSCGLLFHLGRRIARGRILIVGTYRPTETDLERDGERHPLRPVLNELRRRFGDLEIHVGEEESREFLDELLDREPNELSIDFRDRLYRQTRGHPLFTVELISSMRERQMLTRDKEDRWIEGPEMDWETVPARVEGAVGERIGRLSEDLREVLTLASVQGEEFAAEVVAQVRGTGTRETVGLLRRELDERHRLVAARGIRRLNGKRISTYRFRHNLFQKYLYGQMDDAEREYVHEDVGNALESLFGERVEDVAVQLARHFQEAGITSKTLQYLRLAGDKAVRMSANEEAIAHFTRALGLVETLPDGDAAATEELALQLALGPPLLATAGPGADELSRAYLRAHALCDQVGNAQQLFQTLFILVHHHANQGRLLTALELAGQLVKVVESADEPLPAVIAHWARGFALIYLGRLAEALEDHDRVISLYDPGLHSSLAYLFGMDPAVSSLSYGALALWCLGRFERAQDYSRRGLTLARNLDHPSSTAHALLQGAYLNVIRRDTEAVQTLTDELVGRSTEHGVVLFRAWGTLFQGWLLSERGQPEGGIEQMSRGLAACRAAGSRLGHTQVLKLLAEAHARAGQTEEGLALLSDAITMVEETDERLHAASLYRIRGELLTERDSDSTAKAEAAFRRAIEIARAQDAKPWELRATVSLARLLRTRGRHNEARQQLANVFAEFTEGIETPDLVEAQGFLDELP